MIKFIITFNIIFLIIKTLCIRNNSICGLSFLHKIEMDKFIANITVKSHIIFIGKIIDKNCSYEKNNCVIHFNITQIIKTHKKLTINETILIQSGINIPGCFPNNHNHKILIFVQYEPTGVFKLNYAISRYSKKILRIIEDYSCKMCGRMLRIKLTNFFNVTEGDYITITCRGIGKPHLKLRWYKDNLPITLKKQFNSKISTLVFKSVKRTHSGIYQCQAFNDLHNSVIYNSTLIVRKKTFKIKTRCKAPDYCFNNGTCYIYLEQKKKFCLCLDGYSGHRCQSSQFNPTDLEVKSSEHVGANSTNLHSEKILLLFFVVLFCTLLIALIILICVVLRERKSLNKLRLLNKQKQLILFKEYQDKLEIACLPNNSNNSQTLLDTI